MKTTESYMRLLVSVLLCLVTLSVNAENWKSEWYIMVEKAELHSTPNIDSPIVGNVYKGEKPLSGRMNTDGSWVLMKASDTKNEGWVMSCVCEGSKDSYSYSHFDYETCYQLNKALAKGEISQEEFANKLNNLQNYYAVDEEFDEFCDIEEDSTIVYTQETPWISLNLLIIAIIVLWLISWVGLFLSFIPVIKHTSIYILLLGACEILFVLHPDIPTDLRTGRVIEILVLVVGQLLLLVFQSVSTKNAFDKFSTRIGTLMLLAAIGIFIYRYGITNFFVSLIDAIVGIILLIILGAVVRMIIKAPPSIKRKKEEDEPKVDPYTTCRYCRYFNPDCKCILHDGAMRSSGDSCDYFTD